MYFDGKDWIELAADDLDSFIDMIETAQQERENMKRRTLEVNKIAFTLPGVDTATSQQKRLRSSRSPSPNSAAQNAKKKHKLTSSKARCGRGSDARIGTHTALRWLRSIIC